MSKSTDIIEGYSSALGRQVSEYLATSPKDGTIFILPIESTEDEELFNQFAPDIKNYFIQKQTRVEIGHTRKKTVKYQVRHSADVLLPVLYVIGEMAFAIATGILSAYIYDMFVKESDTTLEVDVVNVKTDGGEYKRYKISGNAQDVIEALQTLSKEKKPTMARVDAKQEQAKTRVLKANELVNLADTMVVCKKEKERLYRRALALIRSAYNWSGRSPRYMTMLEELGSRVHSLFGCSIKFEKGTYWRDCPVDLAQIPLGFSIGGQATKVCSVCGCDPLDCEHIAGETYDRVEC